MQVQWSPTYRQIVSGFDLSVPVTVSYVSGKSAALGPGMGVHKGGVVSIAVNGTYLSTYNMGVRYTNYYGPAGLGVFDQNLRDRRFMSVFASTTF